MFRWTSTNNIPCWRTTPGACPPPIPAAPPTNPTNKIWTIDMDFLGAGQIRKLGKHGIEPGLPLPSLGAHDMALMTVLIPVVGPDGQETCKQVSLRALIDDYLRESLLLGWRACSKVSFVRGTQASASETNGVLPSGPSNDYAAAAGMTISSPPPSPGYTATDQSTVDSSYINNMSQAVHQLRSVSSFKNVGHCPEPTLEGLLGNAGLYPNADPGTQHAPMAAATGFANTTSTHILGPQTTTDPKCSGALGEEMYSRFSYDTVIC
ncbi:hypothetical protein VUR80DRAFT_2424 [Thermomyces stellatus]